MVRGGDDPDIHLYILSPPYPPEDPILEDPQELDLQGQAGLADLIQKDGPPIGHLKETGLVGHGPRKGALDVAKEFTLQELLWDGTAVNRQKGLGSPVAVFVNRPGHQLLPCATLPGDQDRAGHISHLADELVQFDHLRAAPDNPLHRLKCFGHPGRDLGPLLLPHLHNAGNHLLDLLHPKRLGDVVIGAKLHRLDGGVRRGVGRHQDDGHLLPKLLKPGQELDAVYGGHLEVRDDQVEGTLSDRPKGLLSILGACDLEALAFEEDAEKVPHPLFVIHNQDPRHSRLHRRDWRFQDFFLSLSTALIRPRRIRATSSFAESIFR